METDLQEVIDHLAERTASVIALDDQVCAVIAYSPHAEKELDRVGRETILARRLPEDARTWFLSFKQNAGDGPFRIPANPDLETRARVGVPIRCGKIKFGYLFLTDGDEKLSDRDVSIAADAARELGAILYRSHLLSSDQRDIEMDLMRNLTGSDPASRAMAVTGMIDRKMWTAATPVVAIVASPAGASSHTLSEHTRIAYEAALRRAGRAVTHGKARYVMRSNYGLLLVDPKDFGGRDGTTAARRLAQLLADAHAEIELDRRFIVGVGGEVADLSQAYVSYRQAADAIRVASVLPELGDVVKWAELGVYRMLARFPLDELTIDHLHPGLAKLGLEAPHFLETLECFLENAGNVAQTATSLFLHRASLHYRLARIKEIAGVDLDSGEVRLSLNMGLKLARLAKLDLTESRASRAS